jgi:hypothetical protein
VLEDAVPSRVALIGSSLPMQIFTDFAPIDTASLALSLIDPNSLDKLLILTNQSKKEL